MKEFLGSGRVKGLALVACAYIFLVGIGAMGDGFKMLGKGVSAQILETTSSPFVGLFIGILATAIVQSSSTTTSLVVGMVAGGVIPLQGAVAMVMGANIGTTITNLIVSLGHITRSMEFRRAFAAATIHDLFNLVAVAVLFPLELATGFLAKLSGTLAGWFEDVGGMKLTSPLKLLTEPAVDLLAMIFGNWPVVLIVISALLTFGMLYSIVRLLRSLVLEKVENFFDEYLFKSATRAMIAGVVLTVLVQSSSITTSLVVPLAGAGVLKLIQIFPYTLGANIGTTLTAMLAALATGSEAAVSVAFAHLLFNVVGIALIWPVPAIRRIPLRMAEGLAAVSVKNRAIPLLLIPLIFFVIPLILIWIFR